MRAPLPGPELDQLVAERVMGWRREEPERGPRRWRPPEDGKSHPARALYGVPRYSTDIAAAWLVAERLGLAVVPDLTGDGTGWYATDIQHVVFGDSVTMIEEERGGVAGETAPYAICLAALVASGLDID